MVLSLWEACDFILPCCLRFAGCSSSVDGSSSEEDAASVCMNAGLESACFPGRLVDILHHVVDQVLLGAKVKFLVNVLTLLMILHT